MSGVGYEQDPTDMILSQLRFQRTLSSKSVTKPLHSYFQVEYMAKQIFKMNPEEAEHYERSVEEENMREYLQQTKRDKQREDMLKYDLKRKYFKIRQLKPLNLKEYTLEEEPIEMLKSFSQPQDFLRKSTRLPSTLRDSQIPISTRSRLDQKSRYSEEFQQLLDESEKLAQTKSRYKLVGGTMIEKEKINEEIMREERKDILQIIKSRDYSQHRPHRLDEISNKEKYNMGYLDYMKTKTKLGLDKSLFEKKIRKIEGRLQYFQEFILREGKIKEGARDKLQDFYIKMREEFRRIQRSHSPKKKRQSVS